MILYKIKNEVESDRCKRKVVKKWFNCLNQSYNDHVIAIKKILLVTTRENHVFFLIHELNYVYMNTIIKMIRDKTTPFKISNISCTAVSNNNFHIENINHNSKGIEKYVSPLQIK